MRFDIDDIASMEADGTFEGVILHEMGHVIGVGCVQQNSRMRSLAGVVHRWCIRLI